MLWLLLGVGCVVEIGRLMDLTREDSTVVINTIPRMLRNKMTRLRSLKLKATGNNKNCNLHLFIFACFLVNLSNLNL